MNTDILADEKNKQPLGAAAALPDMPAGCGTSALSDVPISAAKGLRPLRRIMLVVSYDGTNYCGWQVQPNGTSIQAVLQAAIEDLVSERINLTGASRTDSGVHALGQVAVFDTHMAIAQERFAMALNQRLPRDIAILKSVEVPISFHPRYQKTSKTYEYKILNSAKPRPLCRLYSYFVPQRLNLAAMEAAAGYICGTHDFKNFASTKSNVKDTVRTVHSLTLEKEGDMISLKITGDGFLYNMVRIIAGALLKVGFGQKSPEFIREVLESETRIIPGPTAPAHGLTLMEIRYESLKEGRECCDHRDNNQGHECRDRGENNEGHECCESGEVNE